MAKKPKQPEQRYENNYRYTPEQLRRHLKRAFIAWPICIVASIIVAFIFYAIVTAIYHTNGDDSLLPGWTSPIGTILILGTALALPLLYAAWMGGLAIHRYGPVGTIPAIVGMCVIIGTGDIGAPWIFIGMGIMAFGVIAIFYLGMISNVPIWLQLPIVQSPRLYINKPKAKKKK